MQGIHEMGVVGAFQAAQQGGGQPGVMQQVPPSIPNHSFAACLAGIAGSVGSIIGGTGVGMMVGTAAGVATGGVGLVLSGAVGVGIKILDTISEAGDVGVCRARGLTDEQAQAAVDALRSPRGGRGTIAQQVVDNLPVDLSAQAAHAFLCGAHVVVPNNDLLTQMADSRLSGVSTRSSSHYAGEGQQYGCDIQIPTGGGNVPAHLLFGPAGNGNMFFQLEKHGTGGVANWMGHAMDYLAHKASGNAQVGPMGMVYASEKNQSELTVQGGQVMQGGQPV